jgi:hypothetical protein
MGFPGTIGHWMRLGQEWAYRLVGGSRAYTAGRPWSNDVQRSSLALNGTDEYFAMTTATSLGITNTWSVGGWVRPGSNAMTSYDIFLALADGASNVDLIVFAGRGDVAGDPWEILVYDNGAATNKQYRFGAMVQDVWTHLMATWDGTNLTVYENGIVKTATKTVDGAVTQTDSNRDVYVGVNRDAANNHFHGNIQQIAIWDAELSANAIKTIWNQGDGGSFQLDVDQGDYAESGNLQHWWRLGNEIADMGKDYGAGTAIDIDTNSANISVADISATSPDGVAIEFDGVNEYLRNGTEQSYDVGNSYSVGCWVNITTVATGKAIVDLCQEDVAVNHCRILLWIDAASKLSFFVSDDTPNTCVTEQSTAARADEWYFIVGVKDGTSSIKIYVNGTEAGSNAVGVPTTADTTAFHRKGALCGAARAGDAGGNLLDAHMHSAFLWNTALSAAEVKALYNGGDNRIALGTNAGDYASASDLVHWWRLGKRTGSYGTGGDLCTDWVSSGGINFETDLANIAEADVTQMYRLACGNSVDFDGATEYMADAGEQSVGIGDDWTIGMWVMDRDWDDDAGQVNYLQVYIAGQSGHINIYNDATAANDPVNCLLYKSDGTLFKHYQYNGAAGPGTIFRHLMWTWDGTTLKFYRDGILTAASATPTDNAGSQGTASRRIYLGGTAVPRAQFHQCSIWDTAMDADGCMEVYSRFSAPDLLRDHGSYDYAANLVHWWSPGLEPDNMGEDYGLGNLFDLMDNDVDVTFEDDVIGNAP